MTVLTSKKVICEVGSIEIIQEDDEQVTIELFAETRFTMTIDEYREFVICANQINESTICANQINESTNDQ